MIIIIIIIKRPGCPSELYTQELRYIYLYIAAADNCNARTESVDSDGSTRVTHLHEYFIIAYIILLHTLTHTISRRGGGSRGEIATPPTTGLRRTLNTRGFCTRLMTITRKYVRYRVIESPRLVTGIKCLTTTSIAGLAHQNENIVRTQRRFLLPKYSYWNNTGRADRRKTYVSCCGTRTRIVLDYDFWNGGFITDMSAYPVSLASRLRVFWSAHQRN